jgi:hypothetical protein
MLLTEDSIKEFILTNIEGKHPPQKVLYDFRLNNNSKVINRLNIKDVEALPKNSIIFISDRPNFFFLRLSKSLINKGINTILLTRWGVDSEHSHFFNRVFLFDSLLDLYLLKEVECISIYVQSWVGWFFLPVFIDLITKAKVFCNVNDSSILLFDEVENFLLLGFSKENAIFDIECEKYLYKKLSLVTHPYKDIDFTEGVPSNKSSFYFPCYPLNEFIHNNKRTSLDVVSLVFIGGIPFDVKDNSIFKDAKMRGVVQHTIEQNINMTILNNPLMTESEVSLQSKYKFFSNLSKNSKKFNFKSGYPPWSLYKHTQNFSYGIMLYDFSDILISNRHIGSIVPTKFFTYMEIGIPVIVVDEMEAVANIVLENNLGIVIPYKQIADLNKIINSRYIEYDGFISSISSYNKENNIETKIDDLLTYFN